MKQPDLDRSARIPGRRRFHRQAGALAALPLLIALPACGGDGSSSAAGDGTGAGAGAGNGTGSGTIPDNGAVQPAVALLAPGEEHPHQLTYMAFASDADGIWTEPSEDNAGLDRVRADLIDVAKAIGTYEPVRMFVLTEDEATLASQLLADASAANPAVHRDYLARTAGGAGVEFVVAPAGFNDYWTRDTAPVFARDTANGNRLVAINLGFNGWGNANSRSPDAPPTSNQTKKAAFFQPYGNDRKMAAAIAARHEAPVVESSLILEGGALEWDGEGTAIVTASSILHVNRNPRLFDLTLAGSRVTGATLKADARATVEAELRRLLGVTRVIWLTGTAVFPAIPVDDESDITNGHVDFYAKFLAPGIVAYAFDPSDATGERAITERHRAELTDQVDAKGRTLTLVPLITPETYGTGLSATRKENFAAGYINCYLCNGAVILPAFGDPVADAAAVAAVTPHVGNRVVVQVDITGIGSGGGGLHCATSQVPA